MKAWHGFMDLLVAVLHFAGFWIVYVAFAFIGGFTATSSSTMGAVFKVLYTVFDAVNKLPHLIAGHTGSTASWAFSATVYAMIYALVASLWRQRRIRRRRERDAASTDSRDRQ